MKTRLCGAGFWLTILALSLCDLLTTQEFFWRKVVINALIAVAAFLLPMDPPPLKVTRQAVNRRIEFLDEDE